MMSNLSLVPYENQEANQKEVEITCELVEIEDKEEKLFEEELE